MYLIIYFRGKDKERLVSCGHNLDKCIVCSLALTLVFESTIQIQTNKQTKKTINKKREVQPGQNKYVKISLLLPEFRARK